MKLQQPDKPINIPEKSQWISGIGAGSWFFLTEEKGAFRIKRFSPDGELECNSLFSVTPSEGFDIKKSYHFIYISHCKMCTIKQNDKQFKFYAYGD